MTRLRLALKGESMRKLTSKIRHQPEKIRTDNLLQIASD